MVVKTGVSKGDAEAMKKQLEAGEAKEFCCTGPLLVTTGWAQSRASVSYVWAGRSMQGQVAWCDYTASAITQCWHCVTSHSFDNSVNDMA